MNEYSNHKQLEFLIDELHQIPVDVTHLNTNITKNKISINSLNTIKEIKELFIKNHYLIIRNFGTDDVEALTLATLLSNSVFYQGDDLKYVYQFETEPFQTEILSSSLSCGAFHTDFWTIDSPPNYILLQCVQADPRHPFYSRNQVVLLSLLLEKLELIKKNITKILLGVSLPHRIKDKVIWVKLLTLHKGKLIIRLHPNYIDESMLRSEHYINGVSISHLISDVAQSIADDFVLDTGDILIVSNKYCLHRRGEATVIFNENLLKWDGRKLNTLRFY